MGAATKRAVDALDTSTTSTADTYTKDNDDNNSANNVDEDEESDDLSDREARRDRQLERSIIGKQLQLEEKLKACKKLKKCKQPLFDFAAAFPSLDREFIWIALKAIGIPTDIIFAIRGLYVNYIHFVKR